MSSWMQHMFAFKNKFNLHTNLMNWKSNNIVWISSSEWIIKIFLLKLTTKMTKSTKLSNSTLNNWIPNPNRNFFFLDLLLKAIFIGCYRIEHLRFSASQGRDVGRSYTAIYVGIPLITRWDPIKMKKIRPTPMRQSYAPFWYNNRFFVSLSFFFFHSFEN